jgi:hypothetical protein
MSDENKEQQTVQAAPKQQPAKQEKQEVDPKIAAAQAELLQLELEAKRLEVLEKKANLEDLQERLNERQLRRDAVRQTSITNGATLKALAEEDKKSQKRCNHRKGGNGAAGIIGGQGDSLDYAVIKHTMLNSDMWVRCQRCGKTWKPPVREHYQSDAEFLGAVAEYETAKNFPTKNSASSSYQFRFSDNGAYSREVLRHTTLR